MAQTGRQSGEWTRLLICGSSEARSGGQGCYSVERSSLHLNFPPPGSSDWICKGFSALEAGSYANKELASQPVSPILGTLLFNPRGTESSFLPLCLQSFKPDPFPPSQSSSTGPAPSLSTDPCWMPSGSMSTVPALPTVYCLGGLFPLTLKTSEINPISPFQPGPLQKPVSIPAPCRLLPSSASGFAVFCAKLL